MGGFLRFLLGGVLGAALGFFLSRRQARTALKGPGAYQIIDRTEPLSAPPVAETPVAAAPTEEAAWEPLFVPTAEVELESEAAPWSTLEVEPEPESTPEPELPSEIVEQSSRAEALLAEDELAHVVEPVVVEEAPEVAPPPVERPTTVITAEELRARIEESRRRIREELEEPFQIAEDEPAATEGVAEPEAAEAEVDQTAAAEAEVTSLLSDLAAKEVEPLVEEEPAPVVEIQVADDSFFEELGVRMDRPTVISEPEAEGDLRSRMTGALSVSDDVLRPTPSELETSLNYDVMRARIEEARNRLKAKAAEAQTGMGDEASQEVDAQTAPQEPRSVDDESDADDIEAKIDRLLSEEQY